MDKRIIELSFTADATNTSATQHRIAIDKGPGTFGDEDRTEQISPFEFFKLDESKIPFLGQNYIVVNAKGTDLENGDALIIALSLAATSTPNGTALSASNMANILLFPGNYNAGSDRFVKDEFVNIVGVGARESVILTSSNATATLELYAQTVYTIQNFTVKNTGGGKSIYYSSGTEDNGIWRDLNIQAPGQPDFNWKGSYKHLKCSANYILAGSFSGIANNCEFINFSCGYSDNSDVISEGIISNCTGDSFCFGSASGTVPSLTIGYKISNCKCTGVANFGYSEGNCDIIFAETHFKDCESSGDSFGCASGTGDVEIDTSVVFSNCKSTSRSFGYSNSGSVISYAIFDECVGTENCFMATATGTVLNEGICEDCEGTTSCFGNTGSSGKLINCKIGSSNGVHAGVIDGCNSSADIIVSTGATVKYTTIIPGRVTATDEVFAKIYHCAFRTEPNTTYITNQVETPYNVVDDEV